MSFKPPYMARIRITEQMTDDTLLKTIGVRLAGLRMARNLTLGQLAEQAGLG